MISNTITKLPNPFESKAVKDTKAYGTAMANYILGSTSSYIERRNSKFAKLRKLANGKQDLTPIKKMSSINGDNTFTNLYLKPTSIAKKFENIVVDGYMEGKKEYFKAIALSSTIKEKKDRKKKEAEFRMNYADVINQLSQESAVQLEDPNAFVPESKEHSDIYFQLNDEEKEESLLNQMLAFVANDVDLEDMKRRMLSELFQLNLFGLYEYVDSTGRQKVDFIRGEDCYYSQSYRDDFKDIWYAGREMRMTVSKLRSIFKITDEKEFYKAVSSCAGAITGNSWTGEWDEKYYNASERPYDSNTVYVRHFWCKLSKGMEVLEGKDRNGRDIFDWSYEYGSFRETKDGRKKVSRVYPETAYEGYFLGDKNYCLEWAEQKKQVREDFDKGLIICPFLFFMCGNNGNMDAQSPLESIEDYIQQIDLASLKVKQVIANTPPTGFIIDVNGLAEMDLGTGTLSILDQVDIYKQTGDLYWKSQTENGEQKAQAPIRPTSINLGQLIDPFLTMYNHNLTQIRDILGVNEFRDGSVNPSRVGFRLAQSQIAASNTATLNVYRGFYKTAEKLGKQMGIRIWGALKYGEENKGYLAYLGKENIDFIKYKKDIIESTYDFKMMLALSDEDSEKLEQNIQVCLQAGTLNPEDVIIIRRTANSGLDLAERYLTYISDKRRKEKNQEAQDNAKQQAEATAMAGAEVEKVRQETIQLEAQVSIEKEKTKGEQERSKAMELLAWDLIRKEQEGFPIPEKYLTLVDAVLNNLGLNVIMETTNKEQILQQQMQAQEEEVLAAEIENYAQELQGRVESGEITEEQASIEMEAVINEAQGGTNVSDAQAEQAINDPSQIQ